MKIENPFTWLKKRREDARTAEEIIVLGCAEHAEGFFQACKDFETEGKADAEAVRYIFSIRPDLEQMRQKMHDPNRMFANRHVNSILGGTDMWSRERYFPNSKPSLKKPLINFNRFWEVSGVL